MNRTILLITLKRKSTDIQTQILNKIEKRLKVRPSSYFFFTDKKLQLIFNTPVPHAKSLSTISIIKTIKVQLSDTINSDDNKPNNNNILDLINQKDINKITPYQIQKRLKDKENKTILDSVIPYCFIPYDSQLIIKNNELKNICDRLNDSSIHIEEPIGSPIINSYRNKIEYTVGYNLKGEICVGFLFGSYKNGDANICSPDKCIHIPNIALRIGKDVENMIRESNYRPYDRKTGKGVWRSVLIKIVGNGILCAIQINKEGLSSSDIQIVCENIKNIKYGSNINTDIPTQIEGADKSTDGLSDRTNDFTETNDWTDGLSDKINKNTDGLSDKINNWTDGLSDKTNDWTDGLSDKTNNWADDINQTNLDNKISMFVQYNQSDFNGWFLDRREEDGSISENTHSNYILLSPSKLLNQLTTPPSLRAELLGSKFNVTIDSFFQTNMFCIETLYLKVKEYALLDKSKRISLDSSIIKKLDSNNEKTLLLDLCCGTGTIGIILSDSFSEVIGIDSCYSSIEMAKENSKLSNKNNINYIQGKIENVFGNINMKDYKNITAILDPPRNGVHKSIIKYIKEKIEINRVVYVSCCITQGINNIIDLCQNNNFIVKKVSMVDMFPHTIHYESVFLLERISK